MVTIFPRRILDRRFSEADYRSNQNDVGETVACQTEALCEFIALTIETAFVEAFPPPNPQRSEVTGGALGFNFPYPWRSKFKTVVCGIPKIEGLPTGRPVHFRFDRNILLDQPFPP